MWYNSRMAKRIGSLFILDPDEEEGPEVREATLRRFARMSVEERYAHLVSLMRFAEEMRATSGCAFPRRPQVVKRNAT